MKEKIAIISVLVNLFLAIGKTIIGLIIGSASVLAEGIHSGMDVFSSAISYVGIKTAKKPVDEKHPYGYYKFEVLSGLIITGFLFIAGLWMLYESYQSFINPQILSMSYMALAIMLASIILNEIMARLKIHYGKKENSLSLLSDGVHDKVDVYTSMAVLVGIVLMPYWIYVDSILAFLIGLYIIKESFELGKEAVDSLLDVSAGKETEDEIKAIAKKLNTEISSLKTQQRGSAVTANFKISLPNNLNLKEATKKSDTLREKLIEKIESLEYVVIQITSHEVETAFFKSNLSKDLNWQRKSRFKESIPQAEGKGPEGYCVCPKCSYKIAHQKGTPCAELKCPTCGVTLERE
ncbi:MAG: cation transporter [Candidatus Pacebacteria bacterium]|nr:cation transporter [Candidatus Paceibacterota bacterium]